MPGIQDVGGREEGENSVNWCVLALPRKPGLTPVHIL